MGDRDKKDVKINLTNILSFLEGNFKFYINKISPLDKYLQEQYLYRFRQCKDDCVKEGKCKYCGCPTLKKHFVNKSCNNGERFPNLMSEVMWNKFKIDNNIDI